MAEGDLANVGGRGSRRGLARVRGRDGGQHLAGAPVCLVETRRAGACERAAQLGSERHLAGEHERGRYGPMPGGRRVEHRGGLQDLPEAGAGAPSLRPGQVVVMDNLSSHKGSWVRELIEGRDCELMYLPPYSPDLNPIEEAFAKLKALLRRAGTRTHEALIEAMGRALGAVTASDARGFFEHRGYRAKAHLL